ncbi:MAG: hypothetical protein EXS06_06145 [Planctomycetaceae bacterium]|nr:hypothetical protein [Planctomycetaceae bacterium]
MSASDTSDREYDFALILTGVAELSTVVEDGLFQAGCDDATLSMQYGSLYLEFSRTAASLKDAILSAIRDVQVRCDGDGGQRATGGQSQNHADFPITALLARDVDEYPLCGLWNGRFAMAEEAFVKPPMRLLIAFALVAGGLGLLRNPSSNVPDFGARNSPTGFMAAGDGRSRPAARPDDSCWDAAGEKKRVRSCCHPRSKPTQESRHRACRAIAAAEPGGASILERSLI